MALSLANEPLDPTNTDKIILHGSLFRSDWLVGWQTNPDLDRSDYWTQALQLFYAIRVSEYLHPLRDGDDLDEVRRWIYEGFNWTLQGRFTRWVMCSTQIEANGDVGGPHGQSWGTSSYPFFFKELWKFLDLVNGQSVSVEDKLKRFFSYHMECQKMFCECKQCCNLYDLWQDIDKRSWLQLYNLDSLSVGTSISEMLTWEAENPEDRQTMEYNRGVSRDNVPQMFGHLGEEIDVLCIYGPMTRNTFQTTRAALGTIEVLVPTQDTLEFVVSRQDLGSDHCCPICNEEYEFPSVGNEAQYRHQPIRARCGHVICIDCFDTWIATIGVDNAFACPLCRQTFLPPPRHVEDWVQLKKHLDDGSVRPETSAANILQALEVYLINLPRDQQTEVDLQLNLCNNHFNDLLKCLDNSPSQAIRWAYKGSDSASPEHYRDTGRLAIEFLRLSGVRLQLFLNGDTSQYRAVVRKIWPVFVSYLHRMFITELFEWQDQIME